MTRFGCLTLLLWKLRWMPLINKRHTGTVIGAESTRAVKAANGSVAASTKAAIAKETTLLRCGAEWFVCCGVEAKAMWKVVAILE